MIQEDLVLLFPLWDRARRTSLGGLADLGLRWLRWGHARLEDQRDLLLDDVTVQFSPRHITAGRLLTVRMDFVDRDNLQVALPYEPLPETSYIDNTTLRNQCAVELAERLAKFSCQDTPIPDGTEFRYSYIESQTNEFSMPTLEKDTEIVVLVDGQEVKDYMRTEGKIVIPWNLLTAESVVTIRSL